MNNLWLDLRYGARMLVKKPGFTLVAVLTLALGIGANTAIFSLVSAVLLRPLNYAAPEQLVMVWEEVAAINVKTDTPAVANYVDWKAQSQSFADMTALDQRLYNLTGDGEPERVFAFAVNANFFSLLGANAAQGRTFTADEDKPGANKVVVLSHGLWQTRYGGEPNIVGRNIELNGEKYAVVGVMPPDFQFEYPDVRLWTPIAFKPEQLADRSSHYLEVVARLKPGVTVAQANADMQAIMSRIAAAYPDDAAGTSANVIPLHEQFAGDMRRPVMMLLVAVAFVLLIACANIAGVLLSRAAARQREIAVRAALGASRWRIVRQLLTESLLLGVLGGCLGVLLALWTFSFLQQMIPAGLRASTTLTLDLPVLGFTLAVSLLAGIIFGLAPALAASRADLNEALKQGGRGVSGAAQRWLRSSFVVAEIALALVLLVGAGLLIQTLAKLRGQYAELHLEHVLTARIDLLGDRYRTHEQRVAFYDGVLQRVAHLPGVTAAGFTTAAPLLRKGGSNGLTLEGHENDPNANYNANQRQISPDYFKAIGLALRAGRPFNEQDTERAQPVTIINETMARAYWPGENAIGKRFKIGMPSAQIPWLTVVGVVADVRQMAADEPVKAEMYLPYRQGAAFATFFAPRNLVVRTAGEPTSLVSAVRQAVHEVDPYQPLAGIRTMNEVVSLDTQQHRLGMILLTTFAGLALLLAALGIYGVLSYFVIQHTPEIGVRLALGAQTGDVLRLVIGKGMRLALLGVAIGLAGAFALTRLLQSLLFEVKATDPLTFGLIALLLTLVAFMACYIPARRATKVDPMVALRYE